MPPPLIKKSGKTRRRLACYLHSERFTSGNGITGAIDIAAPQKIISEIARPISGSTASSFIHDYRLLTHAQQSMRKLEGSKHRDKTTPVIYPLAALVVALIFSLDTRVDKVKVFTGV